MVAVCPKILSAGHCDDDSCRFRHDVLVCKPCHMIFPSQHNLDAHLISKKHRAASSGPAIYYCSICDRTMGRPSWNPHVRGAHHRKQATRRSISPNVQPEVPEEVPGSTFCPPCNSHILHKAWKAHIAGRKHRARTQYTKFASALEEAEEDKHGVTVKGNLDFDVVDPSTASTGVSREITINTTVPHALLSVVVRLASSKHRSAFSPYVLRSDVCSTLLKSLTTDLP
ncbi:hypothetical protein IW261DRAFT_255705 [Armillaria novae-zelandiae]|uniref:C2H2-type domain-containing protein n=1 Tax=Armillaria novae-zelandiae TaxID=153914 RepID=A0AA39P5E5_9AGAR|nr:hypothetical protein IW261DRAFT_255705 [Armillaria novae-zelandiae]